MGMEIKVLGDAVKESHQKYIAKKIQCRTMVVEEEVFEDKLVDVEEDVDIDQTKSNNKGADVTQGPDIAEQTVSLGKWSAPNSTRGPGAQVKRRRSENGMSREKRMSLLQDQKVLNGKVFEPTTNNRPCKRELVEVVDFQGWGASVLVACTLLT